MRIQTQVESLTELVHAEADLAFASGAACRRLRNPELEGRLSSMREEHLGHVEQLNLLIVALGGSASPAAPGTMTDVLSRYRPGPAPDDATIAQMLLHRELSLFEKYVAFAARAEVDSQVHIVVARFMRDSLARQAWLSAVIADALAQMAPAALG